MEMADSVNEALEIMYRQDGHTELKRYGEWQKVGKQVKRGEKALLLWGSPKKPLKQERALEDVGGDDKYKFFPICYVFSNLQVADIETA